MDYIQFMELPAIGAFPDDWLENNCEILIDRTIAIARDYVREQKGIMPPLMFVITTKQARTFLPTPDSIENWSPQIGDMFIRQVIQTIPEDELIMFAFANEIFYMEAKPEEGMPESAQEMKKAYEQGEFEMPTEKKDGLMVIIETKTHRYHMTYAVDENRHTKRVHKIVQDRLNPEDDKILTGVMIDVIPKSKGGHE